MYVKENKNNFLEFTVLFLISIVIGSVIIYQVDSNLHYYQGPNNLYTKIPWDIFRRKTPKFRGMCRYYFSAPPNIFHNFVSFHPILMFLTILESGDKTNNIGDKFKTIRLILINTYRYLGSFYSFSDMKTYFGL